MAKKRSKAKSVKPPLAVEASVPVAKTPVVDAINTEEAIAAALSSVAQPVLMKVCRLCETKDGPFLNIFDPETLTAKKTQELMPFVIAEYDDLPHKICFRCSAKVEELHEFVQKCVRTQESLRKALGRSGPKTQTSKLWEEKLHKSNISNDAICDALIKKAMAGIEDLPLKSLPFDESKKQNAAQMDEEEDEESDLPLNRVKRETDKKNGLRPTRQDNLENRNIADKPVGNNQLDLLINKKVTRESESLKNKITPIEVQSDDEEPLQTKNSVKKIKAGITNKKQVDNEKNVSKTNVITSEDDDSDNNIKVKQPDQINLEAGKTLPTKDKNFDIMDHISMIKVNGVGVLFQCKLCNRNFLKKEVVISHACAKTGVPKIDFTTNIAPIPDPPKVTTVKYINTRIDADNRKPAPPTVPPQAVTIPKPTQPSPAEGKSKPKIGPASKVKRPVVGMVVTPREPSPPEPPVTSDAAMPAVEFPAAPNLKSRYKLVPGPNNTFTLMEDVDRDIPVPGIIQKGTPIETRPKLTPVKPSEVPQQIVKNALNQHFQSEVINLDEAEEITPHVSGATPYPVGLFSTVSHTPNILPKPVIPQSAPFTTPAMKKQSYTIVKTGNPSKLLISTKAQPPVEEPPKKKPRKSKLVPKTGENSTPPLNAPLEDSARAKDNFFTFINVDPLLQPSYVLPTDNIIQESQISTSTPQSNASKLSKADPNVYSCNMCSEKFSREKKLLTHIQSHYSKMDEEDQQREKSGKRRGRSSNTNK